MWCEGVCVGVCGGGVGVECVATSNINFDTMIV